MLTLFCSLFSVVCSTVSVAVYLKILSSTPSVRQIENTVAKEMEARAHRLCIQAYEAQRIGNTFERIKADEEFQDNVHLYVEDYQAEVAQRLKEHNVSSISAYGFIRIMK